jgi:deoxyribose-phosphate aldolase
MIDRQLAGRIQHTLYAIGTGPAELDLHCAECIEYGFAGAMVPARLVPAAARVLTGTGIDVCTAVDFPIGLMTDQGRIAEAVAAVTEGATQIDLGVPVGLLRGHADDEFAASIASVVEAVRPVAVKVMLELPLLTSGEAERAVRLAVDAGAQWLKNASSGAVGAATPEQIAFLRAAAPPHVSIKASGSIHSAQRVRELLATGADLVGTSDGVRVVTDSEHEVSANAY